MTETRVLDGIDRRILRVLQRDGRISLQELGERVGLSATPVARRLRALEAAGVIRGYAALIDEAALGYAVSVFVSVRLDRQVDDALARFEATVTGFDEVVDCWLMTGARDYLLRIACEDLEAFERFLTSRLTRAPGVAGIESSIPLRRVKGAASRGA
ncbi:MAG: Lrp/AsnC family transcriptional regulator [Pseudomonadota bacterium]